MTGPDGLVVYWDDRKIKEYLDKKAAMEHLMTFTKMDFRRRKKIREVFQDVRSKVCDLPFGEMAVIYMRFWEELSLTEISLELDLSFQQVEQLLVSALDRLKGVLGHLEPLYNVHLALKCA